MNSKGPVIVLGALLAIATSSLGQNSSLEIKISPASGLPIVYPYHGMLLNHDLSVIPQTNENALVLLRAYSTTLSESVAEGLQTNFTLQRSSTQSLVDAGVAGDVAIEAGLINWLLDNASTEQRRFYSSTYRAIETWAGLSHPGQVEALLVEAEANFLSSLQQLKLTKSAPAEAPQDTSYIEECRAAGVPIPPDWGDSEWQFQDILDSRYTFAGNPDNVTEVWAYADAAVSGACIALPRRNRETQEIELLGIICQSADSGKACFWDNLDKATGARITGGAAEAFRIVDIQDGTMLSENCTNCHRGYNVFMIHPGTALDIGLAFELDPLSRYEPISGQPTWGNPGPMIEIGNRPCASCHEIPEFGNDNNTDPTMPSAFCRIIEMAARRSMPSLNRPAGWETPSPRYAAHVDRFREICTGVDPE